MSDKIISSDKNQMEDWKLRYYQDLAADINNMSFWLPRVQQVDCFALKIPKTSIATVPIDIMELFFMEKKGMTTTEIMEVVYKWVRDKFYPQAFEKLGGGIWFIKNGAFSNKYTFKNCRVLSSDLMELTSQIIDINYASLCMETGGNAEMVAREFIHPPKHIPCIYSGMPLRCEVRVFYDFDSHRCLYAANYWDYDYCAKQICMDPTDKIVYEHEYPRIKERFEKIAPLVMDLLNEKLATINTMHGIWSVDIMENNEFEFYLIDMAVGNRSAYWDPKKIGGVPSGEV